MEHGDSDEVARGRQRSLSLVVAAWGLVLRLTHRHGGATLLVIGVVIGAFMAVLIPIARRQDNV